ncbi:hypothetical protein [Rhizobium leguminosarum]|uniref:hypothetical protein n=1 Tax=Rhizobium leguminosarum TaxID=384 RepID=UPI001C91CA26|nr:hypothetical protein [Rhizobium leguminosarum]MBY2916170.1 hypothetical protein [Rhizobium leguminosarum]MBY2971405.1 hypothetical protein [Rhizobium leguminosarum]MBY2978807.1 hypothetical protein [Rhizobium leguminosarum]MBY3007358.1 hypothetical protein [Rhizobium leguminosarum]
MDLKSFREIVDRNSAKIAPHKASLDALYRYAGLEETGSYQLRMVADVLYDRARAAFSSGHRCAWETCRRLRTDLIREHVILGVPLEPYFEVINHLQDALRSESTAAEIVGNWDIAVEAALDHLEVSDWRTVQPERANARDFEVAKAAKRLRDNGFAIRLSPGWISLEEQSEALLIKRIEGLIADIGGLNVAKRIFASLTPLYDDDQQRYHLVAPTSISGEARPQVPWGYLLQLAVKHLQGRRKRTNTDAHWKKLTAFATAFGAVIDVQPYVAPAIRTFSAEGLLAFLRELALYDSLFRINQQRPADVDRLIRGMLDFLDLEAPTPAGWSVSQALRVVGYILDPARGKNGPFTVAEADVSRAFPEIPKAILHTLLAEVLSHPQSGANQNFSRPSDAPSESNKALGPTFFSKPLLHLGQRNFVVIDRSVCAPACLEALLTQLRAIYKHVDDKVGTAAERFLEGELARRNITTISGDYDYDKEHGECDIVVETPDTLIFIEQKKKALTRAAKAGADDHLLLDLAGSLLAAQAQAGWHEARIESAGYLELTRDGVKAMLRLSNRGIEKIAVTMLDYGSFQDRIVVKHFLESTLNATFSARDPSDTNRFAKINKSLGEIRMQYARKAQTYQPFMNCWFISLPQLLIMFDDVTDAMSFHKALWACRHVTTGTSDLYYEMARMRARTGAKSIQINNG